jgi:hypothetical protein
MNFWDWLFSQQQPYSPAPIDPKYFSLPVSPNIDDRRDEQLSMLQKLTGGLSAEDLGKIFQHPITPFWTLFPERYVNPYAPINIPNRPYTQLQQDVGLGRLDNLGGPVPSFWQSIRLR